jgi:phosphatidate cytidylyltransferase
MLRQRVITAIVLLALFLPALFFPHPVLLPVFGLLMMGLGAWEWGRLNTLPKWAAYASGLLCVVLCLVSWQIGWLDRPLPYVWMAGGAVWVLVTVWLLAAGVQTWQRIPKTLRWAVGIVALWLAWMAMVQAHRIGVNFLMSVLCLVWAADVFAYFAGRAFGLRFTRNKLAPSISPGKSWEGVWGGALGVLCLALLWVLADVRVQPQAASFFSQMYQGGWWLLLIAVAFMVAMSVCGDLIESLIKRSAGVKDSSGLLPGHGGVLDRIDALLPTLPLAMMLTTVAHL